MIFRMFGQMVRRTWPLLLVAWALVVVGTWYLAPPWSEVAQDQEFAFLPEDSPSRRAEAAYAKAFPEDQIGSNIVLVLHRKDNAPGHLERDREFIEKTIEPALRKIADDFGGLASEPTPSEEPLFADENEPPPKPRQRPLVNRIHTPNAPGTGALLSEQALKSLLAKTTQAAARGEFEPFKTSSIFDSTATHPEWLGEEPARIKALMPS